MPLGNAVRGAFEAAEAGARFLFFKGHKEVATGALFGRPAKGLASGWNMSFRGGMPFLLGYAAVSAGLAPRGHKASSAIGAASAPIGTLLGGAIAGPLGALAATFVIDPLVQATVGDAVQKFSEFGSNRARPNFGRGFRDTPIAWTMRQKASSEMSRSLLNAQMWLGNEGSLLHQ